MRKLPLLKLICSMTIFGTIGLALRFTSAERGFVASVRGILGAALLLFAALLMKKWPSVKDIKNNLPRLIASGMAIGVNWILLFESYSYTTIAVATLCYYMAPIFVILASPIVLGAKISGQKYLSVFIAFVGMIFVSGVLSGAETGIAGVLLALGAAALYATVTLLNKGLRSISAYDSTIVQLFVAGLTVLPYTIFAEGQRISALMGTDIAVLLTVCLLNTAVAYLCYFSSVKDLPAETVAIFSYLDPIVAVICSLLLREKMTPSVVIGAALIIGALVLSEIRIKRPNSESNH